MIRRLILISAATALLAACGASTPERPGSKLAPEEAVAQRAQERWDAIIAKDYARAYEYLTPGTRATTPYEAYAKKLAASTLIWSAAQVEDVVCDEPEVCRATVYITFTLRSPPVAFQGVSTETPLNERWLQSAGEWYHLPEPAGAQSLQ